jgi:hypothetical protein
MVALGRLVLSKRERVIALEPYDKGLLGTTLRYPYEVRKAEDYFCDLPDLTIAPDMLTLAEHILDSKASECKAGWSLVGEGNIREADGVFYLLVKDSMGRSRRCDIEYVRWNLHDASNIELITITNWWDTSSGGIIAVRDPSSATNVQTIQMRVN